MVLLARAIARATTNTYGANYLPISLEGNPTGKDHDPAIFGGMDAEKLLARLAMACQALGDDIKDSGGKTFLVEMSILPNSVHTRATKFPSRIVKCNHGKPSL
jgi:hypothetical protein